MSETIVRCPKCGEKLRVTLTLVSKQLPHTKSTETQTQIHVEAIAEPKVELDVKAIDWKPWKKGTGEWVNVLSHGTFRGDSEGWWTARAWRL